MPLVLSFLSRYWKQLLLSILVISLLTFGYNWIYDRGVSDTNQKWEEKEKAREVGIDKQIAAIEGYAKTNLEQTLINHVEVSKDLKNIYINSKKKPLTNIDCAPTTNFTDSFNNTISKGNKK